MFFGRIGNAVVWIVALLVVVGLLRTCGSLMNSSGGYSGSYSTGNDIPIEETSSNTTFVKLSITSCAHCREGCYD